MKEETTKQTLRNSKRTETMNKKEGKKKMTQQDLSCVEQDKLNGFT